MRRAIALVFMLVVAACSEPRSCKRVCEAGDESCELGAPVPLDGCLRYIDGGAP